MLIAVLKQDPFDELSFAMVRLEEAYGFETVCLLLATEVVVLSFPSFVGISSCWFATNLFAGGLFSFKSKAGALLLELVFCLAALLLLLLLLLRTVAPDDNDTVEELILADSGMGMP